MKFEITQEERNTIYQFISKVQVSGNAAKDVAACLVILERMPEIRTEVKREQMKKINK